MLHRGCRPESVFQRHWGGFNSFLLRPGFCARSSTRGKASAPSKTSLLGDISQQLLPLQRSDDMRLHSIRCRRVVQDLSPSDDERGPHIPRLILLHDHLAEEYSVPEPILPILPPFEVGVVGTRAAPDSPGSKRYSSPGSSPPRRSCCAVQLNHGSGSPTSAE